MDKKIYLFCHAGAYMYFEDYITTLMNKTNFSLILWDNPETYKFEEDPNITYIFCGDNSVPKQNLDSKVNKMILNTEQTTRPYHYALYKNLLSQGLKIIDYNIENIINLGNPENTFFVPYQYDDIEIDNLKKIISETPKICDIAFVGCLSPKRHHILQKLGEAGLSILMVEGWKEVRDQNIAKCKILLNIHYDDSYNIYETMRCDRWIFANQLVISETSLKSDILDISDLVIFEKYDNLVNKVIEVINNYDKYYEEYLKKYKNLIELVKEGRHDFLKSLENSLT